MNLLAELARYLIFPGLLFSAGMGLVAGWLDRKVTARLQWRIGPPWYQNFVDLLKLWYKETVLPEGAPVTFVVAPYMGLAAMVLVVTIVGSSLQSPSASVAGDLIVVLYLLLIPAVSLMAGASSSANPLAAVGASREMKLAMAYELPFLLAIAVVMIKTRGLLGLGQLIEYQQAHGSLAASFSGAVALVVVVICMQAKLGFVPFDQAEAEQEIMAGALIEYSGKLLAVFKLTKALLLYVLPLLFITIFFGKDTSPLFLVGKYLLFLLAVILIKNTSPRLRIAQAMHFFWGPLSVLAGSAVALALVGW